MHDFRLAGVGAERSADQILKEIDSVKLPTLNSTKKDNPSAVVKHRIKLREATEKRARLISQLYKIAPDHKRIPALMVERWKTVGSHLAGGRYAELIHELEKVIAQTKDATSRSRRPTCRAKLKLNPVSSKKRS